jgi:hypothetical protein
MLAIMLLPVLCSLTEAQPSKTPEHKDAFADDPKLQRKIKIHCEGMAVGELLALLSQKAGVRLTADRAAADHKVVFFCQARPLRESLVDLAILFHDGWQHSKTADGEDRYILQQPLLSREYEQSLYRAANGRSMAMLEEQVKALGESAEQLARRPETDPIRKNLSKADHRIATQVYAALTPEQRDALFERRILSFSAYEISAQLAGPIRSLYESSLKMTARFRAPGGGQPAEKVEDYARHGVQFVLHNSGGRVIPAVQVYGVGSMHATLFAEVEGRSRSLLPTHGNPYTKAPVAGAAVLPDSSKIQEAQRQMQFVDRLMKLAELTGLPVVSDLYRSHPVNEVTEGEAGDQDRDPAAKRALTALDSFCQQEGYLWWTRPGGGLYFRKRDWYEQQRYEVPDRWLVNVVTRLKAHKNVPTISDALLAKELTSQQVLGLNGLNAGKGYSYSEMETAGTPELLAFLDGELQHPTAGITPEGWDKNRRYERKDVAALARNGSFMKFLNAQSHPIPAPSLQFFRVEFANVDRQPAPADGFKDAQVQMNWTVGSGIFGGHNLLLPIAIPDDRRDKTVIELE